MKSIPFYIVVQDKSQVNLHPSAIKEFISINYDNIINSSLKDSPNNKLHGNKDLFERPINIYPEVYYKFEDEKLTPIIQNINNSNNLDSKAIEAIYNDNDIVVVIDVDEDLNIIDTKCLNHNYQIFNIAKFENSDIVNMKADTFKTFENRTNIIIQITSNELEFINNKLHRSNHNHSNHILKNRDNSSVSLIPEGSETTRNIDEDIKDIQNIVEIFNKRNSQLESFIKLNSNNI